MRSALFTCFQFLPGQTLRFLTFRVLIQETRIEVIAASDGKTVELERRKSGPAQVEIFE